MGAHKKEKSKLKGHFDDELRRHACSSFKSAHVTVRNRIPDKKRLRVGKKASGVPDAVWSKAIENFEAGKPSSSAGQRKVERRSFKKIVERWYNRWDEGKACLRVCKSGCVLSESEIELAVRVIGTPKQQGKSWVHFETIQQAIKSDGAAALRDVLQRKQLTASTLHKLLVDDLKRLNHNVADRRPRLPPGTLASRERAAEVWGRRAPWLTLPVQGAIVSTYFDWEFYFNFTFMIDACSFEDGPGLGKAKSKKVYSIPGKLWGPELDEPEQTIAKGTKLMVYVVIHPHGGLIVGPDLVITGSKVPASDSNQKNSILTEWHDFVTAAA